MNIVHFISEKVIPTEESSRTTSFPDVARQESSSALSTSERIGIGVGVIVFLVIALVLLCCLCRKKKDRYYMEYLQLCFTYVFQEVLQ